MPFNETFTAENLVRTLLSTAASTSSPATIGNPSIRKMAETESRVALPAPVHPFISNEAAMRRRVATRHFASRTIDAARLGTVLAASHLHSAEVGTLHASVAISLYVHAWRVRDIARAYYRYDPGAHSLVYVSSTPRLPHTRFMFRQAEFSGAAAILVVVGDLDDALARHADHGYRLLLLSGAATLHRCWMSAIRVQLVGCLCEAPFRRLNGQPSYPLASGQIALLALALGQARDPAGDGEGDRESGRENG